MCVAFVVVVVCGFFVATPSPKFSLVSGNRRGRNMQSIPQRTTGGLWTYFFFIVTFWD